MNRSFNPMYNYGTTSSPAQQLAVSRFMSRTYGWMSLGLLVTALVSFSVASSEAAVELFIGNRILFYGLLIAEVLLVMGLTASYEKLSAKTATLGFIAYSALNGVTLSVILLVYTMTSIGQVFMISAGMFGGLALFGTVTRRDLTGMGAIFGMGIWGLILVGVANIFIQSDALSMGMSAVGVLVFAGLTAYDAQRIRSLAHQCVGTGENEGKGAVFGALSLYLNFINLFLSLLRLFGSKRS